MNSTPDQGVPDTAGAERPESEPGDAAMIGARDLALAALREITSDATIGDPAGYRTEPDGAISLRFANRMQGYPGWFWTVSLAHVEGSAPTVLEAELMPGDGALLAPEWIPWADRLADYHAHQADVDSALAAETAASRDESEEDADADDDTDDIDDLDAADFDDDGSPILHSGDLDGVDIDSFADEDDAEDDSDEEDDSDSDEDDSDEEDDSDSDEDDSDDDGDEEDDDDESDDVDPRVDRSY